MIMPSRFVTNWRSKLVYSPEIIRRLNEHNDAWKSRSDVEAMVKLLLAREGGPAAPTRLEEGGHMKSKNALLALAFVAIGLTLAALGIYVGETDDAPGAALIGILLLIGSVVLAVRTVRRKA